MTKSRPVIPAEIQRCLLVECGHRCAVCGEPVALEKAHIVPWSKTKDHSIENLIVLCAVCHNRSHQDEWSKKTLEEYKKNPWVRRYRSKPILDSHRELLKLRVSLNKNEFELEKERILSAVEAALDLSRGEVVLISVREGSLIVSLSLPRSALERLFEDKELQQRLREFLLPVALLEIDRDYSLDMPDEPALEGEVTRLLDAWSAGDPEALDELMPLVFDTLERIASRHFGHAPSSHILQPTALVNELYIKLRAQRRVSFHDREKFYSVAAKWIRRILVDHERKRLTSRRGGDVVMIPLMDQMDLPYDKAPDVRALDDALNNLATVHPRQSRILELRIFGGFTFDEIAKVEGLKRSTIKRDWTAAILWLRKELKLS